MTNEKSHTRFRLVAKSNHDWMMHFGGSSSSIRSSSVAQNKISHRTKCNFLTTDRDFSTNTKFYDLKLKDFPT